MDIGYINPAPFLSTDTVVFTMSARTERRRKQEKRRKRVWGDGETLISKTVREK
jgi:hypothetical protein